MQVRLSKCPRCGRIFSTIQALVCRRCEADEEADYVKIGKTIEETPGLTVEQTAAAAAVDLDCVLRMLDQGRLQNANLADPVPCGQCGAPAINVRLRLCVACLAKMDMKCAVAIRELRETLAACNKAGSKGALDVHKTIEVKRQRIENKKAAQKNLRAPAKEQRRRMVVQERLDAGQKRGTRKPR